MSRLIDGAKVPVWSFGLVLLGLFCAISGDGETDCSDDKGGECLGLDFSKRLHDSCPELKREVFVNYYPHGAGDAGNYNPMPEGDNSTEKCTEMCCNSADCNYIMMDTNSGCFLLSCVRGMDSCLPTKIDSVHLAQHLSSKMVFVRGPPSVTCEVGIGTECKSNEECVPMNTRSRDGTCKSKDGYVLSSQLASLPFRDLTEGAEDSTLQPADVPSTVKSMKELVVIAANKNVTLPDNEVSLIVSVTPPESPSNPYTYEWKLIAHPSDDPNEGTKEGQTTNKLHLTGLKQGSYVFQVTVKNSDAIGAANATVIVFQENRTNLAPVAVISPAEQTVQLPTASVVLDAGASKDDDKIVSYTWELQKGPLQYTFNPLKKVNVTTLQIESLVPGNYTFKLTVEDSGRLTNSTTANITVIKETDYPPTAIAGKDMVVHLPVNEVTLNGNSSTDDKKITEWEWKSTGETNKAVDMQDTHTPYLKLSHLEEGIYEYQLKVTDESGQSSTSTVHVFVKKPSGKPPQASAGADQTVSLPQTWALVDASESKADAKIVKYTWTQISGPTNATITQKPETPLANLTGLTKGDYEFQVEVEDDAKLIGKSSVHITVVQKNNEPPIAQAGGEQVITLPQSVAMFNGSLSKDDVMVVVWKWERMPESSAAGVIIGNTDNSPVLQLTNLVPGKYVFKLTVKDEQGLSSEDIATLVVKENKLKIHLLEVITDVSITVLTEADVEKFLQQMSFLLHDTHLVLDKVEAQINTESAILILHGTNDKEEIIDGYKLAVELRQRLRQDVNLLQVPIISIDTVMCLDTCSGHGTCNDSSITGRHCVCDAFWMENFLKRKFGNGERNCDWSKVYVGVVAFLLLTMVIALVWSLLFLFRKNLSAFRSNFATASPPTSMNGSARSSKRHTKRQYTLLDDDEIELEAKDDEEEEYEDSDSDVLFETPSKSSPRSKSNGSSKRFPLPNGAHRNGILKPPRRVKT